MKLRIGQDSYRFWVEQRRWYSGWSVCDAEDLRIVTIERLRHWRSIRFCDTASYKDSFETYKEALAYSKIWWEAYSFKARSLDGITSNKGERIIPATIQH